MCIRDSHHKLREERQLHSILDDIPGIGEKRRKALLRQFGSVEAVAKAEVEELLQAEGMTIPAAEGVYRFFRQTPEEITQPETEEQSFMK